MWNFPDQGLNLCFFHWGCEVLTTNHQGSPELDSKLCFQEFQSPVFLDKGWIYYILIDETGDNIFNR